MSHIGFWATALAVALAAFSVQAQDPPKDDAPSAQSTLCTAIASGDIKTVEAALRNGARLDTDCPEEMAPPLLQAVDSGNIGVVTLLLDRGANVNQTDNGVSATSLHYAAQKENAAMVTLLVKRGGNVNALTDEGLSPLALAVSSSDEVSTIQALIDAGADVNAADDQGDTVLDAAVAKGHRQVAKLLEAKGAKRREVPSVPPMPEETAIPSSVPVAQAPAANAPAGKRTKDGKLIFKGLYVGMPIEHAVAIFQKEDYPPVMPGEPVLGPKPDARGIAKKPDGTLIARRQRLTFDVWIITAHPDGRVKQIMIRGEIVQELFAAKGVADSELVRGFIDNYGLTEGAQLVDQPVKSPIRVPTEFEDTCKALEFVAPSGWYVTINDYKDIVYGELAAKPTAKFD